MTAHEPNGDPSPKTFSDVIGQIEADASLAPARRRDLVSSLRSMARYLDRTPDAIPANTDWLRQRLKLFHPKQAGISDKTFSNIKSAVLAALKRAGAGTRRKDWLPPMAPAWQSLFESIEAEQDGYKLSRLFRWCSEEGFDPAALDDQTIERFAEMLKAETFVKEPRKIARQAVHAWNRQRAAHADWPPITLKPLSSREPWTFPPEAFPESFQKDLDAWCARLGAEDLFDDEAPTRPCRPSTIAHKRFQIREAASALVCSGRSFSEIRSLADLVSVDAIKQALGYMIERMGGKPTEAIFKVASTLKSIARHYVKVSEPDLAKLKALCSRLDRKADRSRPTKQRRMEQFDDDINLAALLLLPEKLVMRAATPGPKPRSAPLRLMVAAALTILLFAPMRVGNLAALDLERHLRWSGKGRRRALHITIPGEEVKNGKPLNCVLTGEALVSIEAYLERGRPALTDADGTALFPRPDGCPKATGDLSQLIKRMVFAETGLDLTPHLIRSLAARLHYRVNTGDIGTIAHVLGDTIQTVQKSYAAQEQKSALKRYQDSVLQEQRAASRVVDRSDLEPWR